jgi:hypothetical protein
MGAFLSIFALLAVQAGKPAPKAPAPTPVAAAPKPLAVANFSVYPISAVSFAATNPDSPTVAGNAGGTVTVSGQIGATEANATFKLQVSAAGPTFSNCTTIPVSAVTITCTSVFNPGNNDVSCASPVTLSTSPVTVASGTLPTAGSGTSFWVTFSYTLTDSWEYIAETSSSCTLNVTYLATVN